jgi:hypothetical protein
MYREALIIISSLIAFGIAGWCHENDEPVYQGIPLTTLLQHAALPSIPHSLKPGKHEGSSLSTADAETAIRTIGTNALPYLVKMIRDEPPARARLAANGFRLLGPTASPAIPGLESAAQRSDSRESCLEAILALRFIGTNALPALGRLCTNSNARDVAVGAVMEMGAKGASIQPFSAEILGPGDASTERAIQGLRNFQPANAIPILTNALQNPNAHIRKLTVEVIRQFGVQARPAVPALTERLYDKDEHVRQATIDLLRGLAPEMFVTNTLAHGAH